MNLLAELLLGNRRSKELRRYLEKRLTKTVIKKFVDAGFQRVPPPKGVGDIKWRRTQALGHLKRTRGNGVDLVDVSLDARGLPSFAILAGIAPPEGCTTVSFGHSVYYEQSELTANNCPEWTVALMNAKRGVPFEPGLLTPKTKRSIDRIVSHAEAGAHQLLAWFETREMGSNLEVESERLFEVIPGRTPEAMTLTEFRARFS